jgi:hypothetical protein
MSYKDDYEINSKETLEQYLKENCEWLNCSDAYAIPYTASGDYVGGFAELSNCNYLDEEYDFVKVEYGCYGSKQAVIDQETIDILDYDDEDVLASIYQFSEDLDDLMSYPLLDDSREQELIMDAYSDAMDDYLVPDFIRELREYLTDEQDDLLIDLTTDEQRGFYEMGINYDNYYTEGLTIVVDYTGMIEQMIAEGMLDTIIMILENASCPIDPYQVMLPFETGICRQAA